jgi:hypothetical protein
MFNCLTALPVSGLCTVGSRKIECGAVVGATVSTVQCSGAGSGTAVFSVVQVLAGLAHLFSHRKAAKNNCFVSQ